MNILLERNSMDTSGENWKGLSDVNGENTMKAMYDKEYDCLPEMNILHEESGVGKFGETGKIVSDASGESPLRVSPRPLKDEISERTDERLIGAVVLQILECVELCTVHHSQVFETAHSGSVCKAVCWTVLE